MLNNCRCFQLDLEKNDVVKTPTHCVSLQLRERGGSASPVIFILILPLGISNIFHADIQPTS